MDVLIGLSEPGEKGLDLIEAFQREPHPVAEAASGDGREGRGDPTVQGFLPVLVGKLGCDTPVVGGEKPVSNEVPAASEHPPRRYVVPG